MSTFLELVRDLHRESGASGSAPTSVVNQFGENLRLVNWIKEADKNIQNLWENWKFLRGTFSQALTVGNAVPPSLPTDVGMWDMDTFRITEAGQTEAFPLQAYEYEDVKEEAADTDSGFPWRVVVMPDNTLRVEGLPDAAHTLSADYYKVPTALASNTDVSVIPPKFHRVIVGRALIYYGNYENAAEAKQQGKEIFEDELNRLENSQLPNRRYSRYKTGNRIEVIAQ